MDMTIQTKQGQIEGKLSQDGRTRLFLGVPYAEPPTGPLRFQRPQEKRPWPRVLPCQDFGPRCPQADLASMDFYGKEFYDDMVPPLQRRLPVLKHLGPGPKQRQAAGAVLDPRRGLYARLWKRKGI